MRKLTLVLSVLALAVCTGDVGPTGPAGATGAVGPAGPTGPAGLDGTSASIRFGIVVIDASGEAALSATGAQVESSVINCYTSTSNTGPWLVVADAWSTTGSPFCGAFNVGADMAIVLLRGTPGWYFLGTVVTVP